VWEGTQIPGAEFPGKNKPGYGGSVFFPGATGTLVKVTPSPK
jgi:hypothetical protein